MIGQSARVKRATRKSARQRGQPKRMLSCVAFSAKAPKCKTVPAHPARGPIDAIEQECLDKFIVFGQEHFDLVCAEYVEHYHSERPAARIWFPTLARPLSSLAVKVEQLSYILFGRRRRRRR